MLELSIMMLHLPTNIITFISPTFVKLGFSPPELNSHLRSRLRLPGDNDKKMARDKW